MFGKREENGVSTTHILTMSPYEHIQEKHANREFKSKHEILHL